MSRTHHEGSVSKQKLSQPVRRQGKRGLPAYVTPWLIAMAIGGLVVPPNVLAWGRDGHVIVAKIAELRLSDKARDAVAEILGEQSIATADNANWADDIKPGHRLSHTVDGRYPNNGKWHFADIPFEAASYDAARDCKNTDCIVDQLDHFRQVMADESASARDRREALLFIIHFCGDIHQPLHCAERNNDHGANDVHVASYEGRGENHMNLHAVWDDNLVYENENLRHLKPEDAAQRLNSLISSQQAQDWAGGEPKDWAWEAHQLAVDQAYTDGDGNALPNDQVDLDNDYVGTRKLVVRQQLQRGGVRLAKVLNAAFGQ